MATISVQGIRGTSARPCAETRAPASPMISMDRTRARASIRSYSRSSRSLPTTKLDVSSAASSMCRSRTSSSLRILHRSRIQHLLAEVPAQVLWRAQVYLPPPQHLRKLLLHPSKPEEARCVPFLEFDEHVYVTVRPE